MAAMHGTKKDGTNVFCSCREASDANYFQLWCDHEDRSPSLEYLHDTIDSLRSKYKNSDFLAMRDSKPLVKLEHLTLGLARWPHNVITACGQEIR